MPAPMAARPATAQRAMSELQMLANFKRQTQRQYINLPSVSLTSYGQTVRFDLPQVGYLASLKLYFSGTHTSGSGTASGNFATYPQLPFNTISRIRLVTNDNVELVNMSGAMLNLWNMTRNRLQNFAADAFTTLNANNRALLFTNQLTGAAAASTAYTAQFCMDVPTMLDNQSMLGLILMQNLQTRVSCEITLGPSSALGAITGVTFTPNVTCTPIMETFTYLIDPTARPSLKYVPLLREEQVGFNFNGDWIYRPQTGPTFMQVFGYLENNGAQVAPANIGNVKWSYATSVTPVQSTYAQHVLLNKQLMGQTLPDGALNWDFTAGLGTLPNIDARDLLNTALTTDLQFVANVTGITPSNAQFRAGVWQYSLIPGQ